MKKHLKEILYLSSPVFVQNVLVSVAGYMERNRRYGGVFDSYTKELMRSEFLSREEKDKVQQQHLDEILTHAVKTVPFYRDLKLEQVDLSLFPVLNRREVADNVAAFCSDIFNHKELMRIFTGGSTGTPLGIYLTKSMRQMTYAFWNRFYRGFGVEVLDKRATFLGRKIQSPDINRPPFWRFNLPGNQLVLSSFHMTDENLHYYIEQLNKFKPVLIEGYPLSVYRISEFILDNNIKLDFNPKGISTSSENFSGKERAMMERAFGCKLYDQYGSAESVIFAGECEYGNKHIAMEYGVAEILHSDGSISSEGSGELIVTTLLNEAMPLIRYRIGDLGTIVNETCACGRNTPILKKLSGKVGAVVVANGKKVPTAAIAFAFEYLENISKAQIIQNEPEKVLVKLVPKTGFSIKDQEFMEWELHKMLGEQLEIDVERVDDIPPEANGKYKMVIQNYYK